MQNFQYELLEEYGYTIHIRLRGGEAAAAEKYQNTQPDDVLLIVFVYNNSSYYT